MFLVILLSFVIYNLLQMPYDCTGIQERGGFVFVDFDIYPTRLVSTYRLLSSSHKCASAAKGQKILGGFA